MSRPDARTGTLFLQPVALVPRRRPTQSSCISTSSYSNNHQEETQRPMNNDDRPCPSSQRHTIARTHARKPSPQRNKSTLLTLLTLPVPIPSYRSPPSYKAPSHLGKSNPPLLSAPAQHYLYLSSAAPAEHAKQRAQPSTNRDTAEALQTGAGPCLNIAIRLVPLTLRCATLFLRRPCR
jgi:hypothetical protein